MDGSANDDGTILIAPTTEIVLVGDVPCRRWIGRNERGTFDVLVHRIGSPDPTAQAWLDANLIFINSGPPPAPVDLDFLRNADGPGGGPPGAVDWRVWHPPTRHQGCTPGIG